MAAAKKAARKRTAQKRSPTGAQGDAFPRLVAFELGGWETVLEKDVHVDVSPLRTVLVGRNGAGKSAILDGVIDAAGRALGRPVDGSGPRRFRCDVEIGGTRIAYEQSWMQHVDRSAAEPMQVRWSERCWQLADNREVWAVERDKLRMRVSGDTTPRLRCPRGVVCCPARSQRR